ncbi:hypothetical protein [Aneurinibacillus migulanus]|uniref:Uncharacterized protein n=1 Tax=Aneurinibacillus migulanus TaxID=47500 RepID=A0A0D1WFW0_ANEMI|nr:hypothetical protein [Aneurinibacillus migulanus]KIV57440.1 hypothetical protein TS65_09350 [Aneurinibacillus migulanus]KON94949.1 hypothetical protein AF333_05075 [Aneurinibacillus migulanus]MED0892762.1 hypothetical protein [Aneurinibacillus migulanus]MED1619008.1 hypothetical protein [Aneurinibacillus migulanus]SDI95230.1 hypothetical protein SAMN04487909_109206 [Aneurinibacillus migulanus]
MKAIKIIDSIMGAGKTSWALQHIEGAPVYKKFIYITPYLDEVQRIITSVESRTFIEPNNNNSEGRKLRSLKELIVAGKDIAATHSLFQTADDELIELLTDSGYTLILDEVMDVIERANIGNHDIKALLDSKYIEIVENRVSWIYDGYTDGRFNDIKLLARAGNLFIHRGSFLLWAFPPRVFQAFDDVYVLTYLFNAQVQRYYYDLHGLEYEFHAVRYNGQAFELSEYDRGAERREELMSLIDLYEGKLNDVAERSNALSTTWLSRANESVLDGLKKAISNYFRNIVKAKSNEIMWTTVKDRRSDLAGKGYSKAFTACNLRATNEYADRWALAYVYNRYCHPIERVFFEDNGVTVDQDLFAVSDLLQWVWRSRIRKGETIHLYLPSSRMRSLLKAWAMYEI